MNAFLIVLAICIVLGFIAALPKIFSNRKEMAQVAAEQCGSDLNWVKRRSMGTIPVMVLGMVIMTGFLALGLYIGFYYTVGVASIYLTCFSYVLAIELANYAFASKYSKQDQNVYAAA